MRKYKSGNYKSGSTAEAFDFVLEALKNRFDAEGEKWVTIGKYNLTSSSDMQRK